MKSLAGKITLEYTQAARDAKPVELRLLIQPLLRFEVQDEPKCLDGAIFAYAQGTAPMAILLLEARKNGESHRWHYACAKTGSGSVTAKYADKEIFSVEKYDFSHDPKQTFLIVPRQPVSKE